jgi:hypothetical protein
MSNNIDIIKTFRKNNTFYQGTFLVSANPPVCEIIPNLENSMANFIPEDGNDNIIYGCTFPWADNYNPSATVDDGSCFKYGCTIQTAQNYDPQATINDDSCILSPIITIQPQGSSVYVGSTYQFNVGVFSNLNTSYQWRNGTSDITGATLSSYKITNIQYINSGNYYVVVTNSLGSVSSVSVPLIVN